MLADGQGSTEDMVDDGLFGGISEDKATIKVGRGPKGDPQETFLGLKGKVGVLTG